MRRSIIVLLIFATACLGGAVPAVMVTKLTPDPFVPKPAFYKIRIYPKSQPRCAYTELATLSADQTRDMRTVDDLVEVLSVKAREVGGDAMINLSSTTRTERTTGEASTTGRDGTVTLSKTEVWTTTVVKFKNADCAD
jgi:hypothetical protein